MKITKIKKTFSDSRGVIKDVLIAKGVAITYITCKSGAVRGNHYHKKTMQYEYVLHGELFYYCRKGDKGAVRKKRVVSGDLIHISPYEIHTFKALKDSEILSFNFFSKRNGLKKDTYKTNLLLA